MGLVHTDSISAIMNANEIT